jgi:putative tricarboxylic transport membrane protein
MSQIIEVFAQLLQPSALMWSLLGVTGGIVVGAVPGLGGGLLMALILPMTFAMESLDAQILLIGIYVGGVSGSMISAILIGVPGAPSAVMTTLDGYAMNRQGKAARALSLGIMGSVIGGLLAGAILYFLAVPLASVAITFRSFDYFAFVVMGLVLIAFTGGTAPVLGLISGAFGVFVSTVGFDNVAASTRFTFGNSALANGFDILPVLIGAYAIRQILEDIQSPPKLVQGNAKAPSIKEILTHAGSVWKHRSNVVRSSLIGSFVGILPGIGPNVGAIMSYTVAQSMSKNREQFGKGSEEAIVAAETGNNATVGGALVPMLALGIPGSGQDVFLLAALILHSIEPGPLMVFEHPDIFYGIIGTYMIANILMGLVMIFLISLFVRVISVPLHLLFPIVLVFCVIGVVASNNRLEDAWVMFAFGLVGLLMSWGCIPIAPFVIGFILGPMAEERIRSALMSTKGEVLPLLKLPIGTSILAACALVLILPLARSGLA